MKARGAILTARCLALVCCMPGLMAPGAAFAYGGDHHARLTEIAVAQYNRSIGQGSPSRKKPLAAHCRIDAKLQKIMITGNQYEDKKFFLVRLSTWHFYDPNGRKQGGCFLPWVETSFHAYYDQVCKRIDALAVRYTKTGDPNTRDLAYENLGHLLHYIQDCSIPAHVIPVFHPRLAWPPGDSFEEYPIDVNALSRTGVFDQVLGGEPGDTLSYSFTDLIDQTAGDVMTAIRRGIKAFDPAGTAVTWEQAYWKTSPRRYGDCGNTFGAIAECRDSSGKRYRVSKSAMEQFAYERHHQAVAYSIRAIQRFNLLFYGGICSGQDLQRGAPKR